MAMIVFMSVQTILFKNIESRLPFSAAKLHQITRFANYSGFILLRADQCRIRFRTGQSYTRHLFRRKGVRRRVERRITSTRAISRGDTSGVCGGFWRLLIQIGSEEFSDDVFIRIVSKK
eukprot:NODE_354_length_10253_cov_0.271519.p10 type:complete len:119 gc:universal NODE_354_length_10253_cov_0.271519:6584-6228(-)